MTDCVRSCARGALRIDRLTPGFTAKPSQVRASGYAAARHRLRGTSGSLAAFVFRRP